MEVNVCVLSFDLSMWNDLLCIVVAVVGATLRPCLDVVGFTSIHIY